MKIALTSAALALGLAGCGLLDAEAQSKHLCVQQTNIANVPAAPPISVPATPPVTTRLDLAAAVPDPSRSDTTIHIYPDTITVGSTTGDVSFAGVNTATVTVLPPAGRTDLQPIVFRYERASPAPAQVLAVEARPDARVDLAPYLEARQLRVTFTFSGVAPQTAWTATLELCGDTRVRVNYWDRITS